jgi:hypothetical protein
VFPARYELNSYIVFRKRLVSKKLSPILTSKETYYVSTTKVNSLMPLRNKNKSLFVVKTIRNTWIYTVDRMQSLCMLKYVVHTATTGVQCIQRWVICFRFVLQIQKYLNGIGTKPPPSSECATVDISFSSPGGARAMKEDRTNSHYK